MVLAPVVRGRKGEYGKLLEELRAEGFTRVEGRRRAAPARGGHRARQEVQARHRGRGRPPRDAARPAQRLADSVETAVAAGRRPGRDRGGAERGRGRGPDLLGALRLPDVRARACPSSSRGSSPSTRRTAPARGAPGLGSQMEIDPDLVVPDPSLSLGEGAILPWSTGASNYYDQMTQAIAERYEIDMETRLAGPARGGARRLPVRDGRRPPLHLLPQPLRPPALLHDDLRGHRAQPRAALPRDRLRVLAREDRGVHVGPPVPRVRWRAARPESLAVQVGGLGIHELTRMSARRAIEWFERLELSDTERQIARLILREIDERLRFLDNVGVGYLSLDRAAATLSGGEAQRIRLATQIGSSLVGRPLHPRRALDRPPPARQRAPHRHARAAPRPRQHGDRGRARRGDDARRGPHRRPRARRRRARRAHRGRGHAGGHHGRRVVAHRAVPHRRQREIPVPAKRRRPTGTIEIEAASQHNLKKIDVSVPLGVFCCVTGVSGSGKSTLVNEVLYKAVANRLHRAKLRPGAHRRIEGLEQIDKIINIDQSPIGRTPRSNPATYTGVFDSIRDLFSRTQESRARGYKPGRFSFNVKGGRCEVCRGDGQIKIEMHFLPDVYVPCEQCDGKRYNRETLEVRFKGKSIADVLEMSVEDAVEFFTQHPEDQAAPPGAPRRWSRLHPARPAGHHAVGRRGAARQARDRAAPRSRRDGRSTSSTSPRPACTSRTCSASSRCSSGSWTPATPSW